MIYKLDNNTSLEVEGNKIRVLPDGDWYQFDVDNNPQVKVAALDFVTALIEYENDKKIIVCIMGNEIILG